MSSSARSWREATIDVAAAAFPPVVLLLVPFNDILFANVRDLLYNPPLVRTFFIVGVATWAGGFFVVRRFQGRSVARLWLTLPWAVLLLDVLGGILVRRGVGAGTVALTDALVLLAVVATTVMSPWRAVRAVAAAAGVALFVQGTVAHLRFVQELPRELVVGSHTTESAPPDVPVSEQSGNVYHILLDNYLSESFAWSVGAAAESRFRGFTFYTRFNTNFPHTSSSEPALVEGRFPDAGMSIGEWPARALREGFWQDLAEGEVALWLYPYGRWLCHERALQCVASTDLERDSGATATRDATIDLWALRLLPVSVREALDDDDTEPGRGVGISVTEAVRGLFAPDEEQGRIEGVRSLPTQHFNLEQFDRLLVDEARRPARGQYVYYHGLIPHHAFLKDERCELVPEPSYGAEEYWAFVSCANIMIERLVQRLHELDRLEDALIIVHADHGDSDFLSAPDVMGGDISFALDPIARTYQQPDLSYRASYEPDIMAGDSAAWRSIAVEVLSSGLLLVKPPRATVYTEDARPVQLLDIAPTILAHFGQSSAAYEGLPISQVTPGRESVFYAHSRDFDRKFSKYRLTPGGWRFVEDVPVRP